MCDLDLRILTRLGEGCSPGEIATEFSYAHCTISKHLAYIYVVLGARNATEAVTIAMARYLIWPDFSWNEQATAKEVMPAPICRNAPSWLGTGEFREGSLNELDLRILTRAGEGCTNEEIAAELHYSHGSIKNRLMLIFEVLDVENRTQAVLTAMAERLIWPNMTWPSQRLPFR